MAGDEVTMTGVAAWGGVGVGFVNDPTNAKLHRAVVLTLHTAHGPLLGALSGEAARLLGEQLIEHAGGLTELEVVAELPPELRGG